ncbi:MAG: ATP-binding protein [Promethearchaeota archaeon]
MGRINLDKAINSSFEDIGNLTKADRVSLFLFDENNKFFRNTHGWCAKGIISQIDNLQKVDIGITSWWINQVIFQKGYKKDNSIRGMGIGLSLVKKIIESYHGKIWVENRIENDYSQDTNFVVEIPEVN